MNEPLRDGGLVLYQASWGPVGRAGPATPLFSTFAVVRNPADQLAALRLHRDRGRARAALHAQARPLRARRRRARHEARWSCESLAAALPAWSAPLQEPPAEHAGRSRRRQPPRSATRPRSTAPRRALAGAHARAGREPAGPGRRARQAALDLRRLHAAALQRQAHASRRPRTGQARRRSSGCSTRSSSRQRPPSTASSWSQNQEVIEAIGLDVAGKQQARPLLASTSCSRACEKLFALAREYARDRREGAQLAAAADRRSSPSNVMTLRLRHQPATRPSRWSRRRRADVAETWRARRAAPGGAPLRMHTCSSRSIGARADLAACSSEHLASFHGASVARAERAASTTRSRSSSPTTRLES